MSTKISYQGNSDVFPLNPKIFIILDATYHSVQHRYRYSTPGENSRVSRKNIFLLVDISHIDAYRTTVDTGRDLEQTRYQQSGGCNKNVKHIDAVLWYCT